MKTPHRRPFFLLACTVVFVVGCASTGLIDTGSDGSILLDGVPFFSQEAYQCGPTVLATVMDYWYRRAGTGGKWVTPEQIAKEIYSPTAKGVLGIDLELYGQRHGFQGSEYSGSITDLRKKVDEGVPVIIFVDYGLSIYQVNHFMVVKGYTRDGVIVNSGHRENQPISDKELEKIWKKNRYWSLSLRPSPSSS